MTTFVRLQLAKVLCVSLYLCSIGVGPVTAQTNEPVFETRKFRIQPGFSAC